MCVASYGVMPHTYMRAGPSGRRVTGAPDAVSKTLTSGPGPKPSSFGTSGLDHARMRAA
jgi:hypothetical protein